MPDSSKQQTGTEYEPLDDECPICGGEGIVHECFDGFCEDADVGCDDCIRSCECNRKEPGTASDHPNSGPSAGRE